MCGHILSIVRLAFYSIHLPLGPLANLTSQQSSIAQWILQSFLERLQVIPCILKAHDINMIHPTQSHTDISKTHRPSSVCSKQNRTGKVCSVPGSR